MSKLEEGERRLCAACGTVIVGALTKDGKVAPIVLAPAENGNVLLFRSPTGRAHCRTFAGPVLEALVAQGVPMRLNHFADCKERDRFKREGP